MKLSEAQAWAEGAFDERTVAARTVGLETIAARGPGSGFSPFLRWDAERAREGSRKMMLAADAAGGGDAGLEAAKQRFDELLATEDVGLARFALKLFITHHRDGRRLRIPALETRAPLKVFPSGRPLPVPSAGEEALGAQEALLNWWREDPEANEHHDHWHAVYPTQGLADPRPGDREHTRLQDRQGELFFYMHEQMLARYDTERLAVGLGLVEPLEPDVAPIREGYDPTQGLRGLPPQIWTPDGAPRPRPDGAVMPEELNDPRLDQPIPLTSLSTFHERLKQAVRSGRLRNASGTFSATDIDSLGHATEPSVPEGVTVDRSSVPDLRHYGNLHGLGHVFLALAAGDPAGVMSDTDTAIRDPVFFRWHRYIDDLAYDWQNGQAPHDLADHAARVRLRSPPSDTPGRPGESRDILLIPGEDFDDAELRHQLSDPSADFTGTDEIHTQMLWRRLEVVPNLEEPVDIPYLDHLPFAYAVRMQNEDGDDKDVTIRLFIVADEVFEQRRQWIELDKFRHPVSGESTVALRRARESSVIRKPGTKPPGPTRHTTADWSARDPNTYCECGWPYNLLMPRGTADGMKFWLAAIVTDWSLDQVESSECGSMSYCGATDRYPDARAMGYPFDRPFEDDDIAGTLDAARNAAMRSFRIRWLNPSFPE